jgi:hypothetical protein
LIPTKYVLRGYVVEYDPGTKTASISKQNQVLTKVKLSKPTVGSYKLTVNNAIDKLEQAVYGDENRLGPRSIQSLKLPTRGVYQNIEEEITTEWKAFLAELGATGVTSATSSTATAPGATPAPPNPADVAKKKADIQKNLQGIPGVDASKAVTNLTDPKDDSGIDAAITKVLTDPATSQQAKQLLAKGMK